MITLERLRSYSDEPKELLRQLKALEDHTANAVKRLDAAFLPNFTVTRRETHARANVGEFVVANTVAQHITLTFPAASAQNAGRCIAVMKTSAAFTLTLAVAQGLISGASTELIGTAGRLYVYLSDGAGWWRTG